MEGQEYLNQISAAARPAKESKTKKILSSKLFIFGIVALVLFILMAIVGAILGGNRDNEKILNYRLKLHLDNTAEVIQEYQTNIKSSDLRSSSSSLNSILTGTSQQLTNYLTEKYAFKESSIDEKIVEQANLGKDGLESELFEAKINGILDRIYAHKMAYEISVLMSEESKLMDMTKNETLDNLLKTSYDSLNVLYEKFNDFSETK